MISKYLDKNNLHHAYLIEGERENTALEVLEYLKSLGFKTSNNPDFFHIKTDSFKTEDARNLKSFMAERSFSDEKNAKKIFVISTNSFLLEAQNMMLKMFEDPIEDTHFFVVVPDLSALLSTFVSRFYVISPKQNLYTELKEAEKFIAMPLEKRIDFIKELLVEPEEDVPTESRGFTTAQAVGKDVSLDSTRAKSLKFLNALESVLHKKLVNFTGLLQPSAGTFPAQNSLQACFEQIFTAREFLRQPGSSTKSLMESVALTVPVL